MKRWHRPEPDEDDEEGGRVSPRDRWRQAAPLFDDDEDEGIDQDRWHKLEKKVRAGRYRPRHSDPWSLHVLYNNLRDLGDL